MWSLIWRGPVAAKGATATAAENTTPTIDVRANGGPPQRPSISGQGRFGPALNTAGVPGLPGPVEAVHCQ